MSKTYTDFPISEIDLNHLFYIDGEDFRQRCDSSFCLDEFEVVKLNKKDLENIVNNNKYNICPECLRYKTKL